MSQERGVIQRVLSFPVVLGLALMMTCFLLATEKHGGRQIIADPDIWWHLSNARDLLTTGHFVRTDTHTYTVAGKPWINFEWLAELPYSFGYRWFGDRGVFVVMMGVLSGIVVGVYLLGCRRTGDIKAAFLATWLTVMLATVSLAPRTLLFGWLLLIVELGILWGLRDGKDRTWSLPLLFLVWINTHGSWFIGFVLLGVFIASGLVEGEWGGLKAVAWTPGQRKKLLLVFAASFALLFVNPYGWRLVAYPLDVTFKQGLTLGFIQEWSSLDFHSPLGKMVLLTLMLLVVVNLVRRRTWMLEDLLFTLIAVYGALTYSRFVFLAGIVVCPLLAIDLKGVLGPYDRKQEKVGVNALAIAVMLAVVAWRMPSKTALHADVAAYDPEKALAVVARLDPKARLLNYFEWGGYLSWNLPERMVFIDSRVDIFVHEGVMADYVRLMAADGALEVLDRRQIQYVLFAKGLPLTYLLEHSAGWRVAYVDDNAELFERVAAK